MVIDSLFFLFALILFAAAFLAASSSSAFCEKCFHFLQPSKSISACMQPHSMTFLSNQTKFTGWSDWVSTRRQARGAGTGSTNLGQEVIAAGGQCLMPVALQRAGRQRNNDDRTLEHLHVGKLVLLVRLALYLFRGTAG